MYFTRGVWRMTGVWVTLRAFSATLPVGNPSHGYVQDLRETHPVTFPTVMHLEVLLAICPRWRGMTAKAVDAEGYSGWQIQTHCYIIHKQCFKPVACGKQINSFTVKCLIRPGSEAELLMNRAYFELRPTQIIKTGWIDSHVDLNCSWTKFKTRKMLISVKLLTKLIIIIYALGSVHDKFGVWIITVPKSLQRRNSRPR